MAVRVDRRDVRPRCVRRGRSFVYVLPCRDRDLSKIGFSREPLERFQTLHPRYFEFFDLERGLLIEADRVSDARRIEREFITTYVEQRAEAPSEVPRSAAGHTEWFSGIHPLAVEKPMSCAAPQDSRFIRRFAIGCVASLQRAPACYSIGRIVYSKPSNTSGST